MPIRITPAVKAMLIACFAMFIIQQTADQFFDGRVLQWLALTPSDFVVNHRFWQLLTYPFLHGEVMHLFLNLVMLAFIGGELEATWGTARFLRYYFFCSTSAGLLYLFLQIFVWKGTGFQTPMVGASGAIYGLLMAYGLIFGERVLLFMMLFPMKAKYFIWILAAIEFMSTVFSGPKSLASAAHLGGMAAGFAFLYVRATLIVAKRKRAENAASPRRKKKGKSGGHLKLIIDNDKEKSEEEIPKTWH
jgi:membrane associated rhomboid family serine protease